jgi:hypothetical protein
MFASKSKTAEAAEIHRSAAGCLGCFVNHRGLNLLPKHRLFPAPFPVFTNRRSRLVHAGHAEGNPHEDVNR